MTTQAQSVAINGSQINSSGVLQVAGGGTGLATITAGQIPYGNGTSALSTSANMTFNGTSLTLANDATIHGLTVGLGGGAVSTNTAVGTTALTSNTTGAQNTAIGYSALYANTTGSYNIAIGGLDGPGQSPLRFNVGGANNVAIGNGACQTNVNGSNSVAIGYQASYSSTLGGQVAVGYQAGYNMVSQVLIAVGNQAAYNTTGAYCTALGHLAGHENTTGTANTYVGYTTGYNALGQNNTAVGSQSLSSNTGSGGVGDSNSAFGVGSMFNLTTGDNNVGLGFNAMQSATSASYNTTVGYSSGYALTSGGTNTMIGYQAGTGVSTGSFNTLIGNSATCSSPTDNGEIVIAAQGGVVYGMGANTGYIAPGSGAVYQGNNSATWSVSSDRRLKKNIVDNTVGLEAVNQIRVRNFEYRLPEEVEELPPTSAIKKEGVQIGCIAQELLEVLPDCVKEESTGVMAVDSSNIVWHLINAIQELSAKNDALEARIAALEAK